MVKEAEFKIEDIPADRISDYFEDMVALHGDQTAFTTVLPNGAEGSVSFNDCLREARAVAAYLHDELGLRKGDVVALMSPNALYYPIIAHGVFMAGLTLTNLNPLYTASEVHHQLSDSGAKALFMLDMFGDKLDEGTKDTNVETIISMSLVEYFKPLNKALIGFMMKYIKKSIPKPTKAFDLPFSEVLKKGHALVASGAAVSAYRKDVNRDDVALYQYTGGTTGVSKGAMLTHGNLMSNVHQLALADGDVFGRGSLAGDNVLLMLPLYHVYALLFGLMIAPLTGCHIVLIPSPRPMSNVKAAIDKYPPAILPALNTLYQNLLDEHWFVENPPKSLRYCVSGAAPLSKVVADKIEDVTGISVREGYGMTETTAVVSFSRTYLDNVWGSVGTPIPGTEIRLINEHGVDAEPGRRGEIWVKGPQVMAGYLNRSDATAEAIEDGWLKTGDVGKFDEDGELYIVDRMKDMIIVSGFNVFPTDLEEAIVTHEGIAEVCVVSVLDDHAGERPVACVVKSDESLTEADVLSHARQTLTGYKMPKEIRFVSELPKSPVGKVLRRVLREQVRAGEV